MNLKAQKMVDLIWDELAEEGGQESIQAGFYDYKNKLRYRVKLTICKSAIEDEEETVEGE